jgi:hypothetical protein
MFVEKSERDDNLKLIKSTNELKSTLLNSPMVVAYMTREKPEGEINGRNRDFMLSHPPVNASEKVYLNGLLQEYGQDRDYTVSKNCVKFCLPPEPGDRLVITYRFQV